MHKCLRVEGNYFEGLLLWYISVFFNKLFITTVSLLFGHTSYASPIRLLCEELSKVYVFSEHMIFSTLCALFPNKISCFKVLTMP